MLLRLAILQFASSPSSIAYIFKPLLELENGAEMRWTNPCQSQRGIISIWAFDWANGTHREHVLYVKITDTGF